MYQVAPRMGRAVPPTCATSAQTLPKPRIWVRPSTARHSTDVPCRAHTWQAGHARRCQPDSRTKVDIKRWVPWKLHCCLLTTRVQGIALHGNVNHPDSRYRKLMRTSSSPRTRSTASSVSGPHVQETFCIFHGVTNKI